MYIILIIIALIVFFRIKHYFKIPKCGNMVLVTGGIKTGKSTLSVRMAYKTWKKQVRKVKIHNFFCKVFGKFFKRFRGKEKPLPLLYSNIPLNVPYVPITKSILERTERLVYGSVAYFCESSLIVDSQFFSDKIVNEKLLLLIKLWAHETKGGYAFYDTQSINDNHYAVKRCLSSYFYIHHTIQIPFIMVMFVREMKYSEDNGEINTIQSDLEDGLKMVIVPKHTWKMFDYHCYSIFTDDLPVSDKVVNPADLPDLKARKIIALKNYYTLPKEFIDKGEEKENANS